LTHAPKTSAKKEGKQELLSKQQLSPAAKRLKVQRNNSYATVKASSIPGPKQSSYVEKQYNSVWLAVPSNVPGTVSQRRERAPPKPRTDTTSMVRKPRTKSTKVFGNKVSSLPVIEETEEFKTGCANECTSMHGKSRSKRSTIPLCLPEDKESICSEELSSVRPTLKTSRKRTFTEATTKSDEETTAEATDPMEMTISRHRVSLFNLMTSDQSASSIDTTTLKKQKVLSYPRNRIHYYNRVVRRNISNTDRTAAFKSIDNDEDTYYFVLEYNEEKGLICIVPMIVGGVLTGKRSGRPRYQCVMDHKFMVEEADKFYIVPSAMIMKTPYVAQEAWDIATESDTDFATR
jgi:hypothetical protein